MVAVLFVVLVVLVVLVGGGGGGGVAGAGLDRGGAEQLGPCVGRGCWRVC